MSLLVTLSDGDSHTVPLGDADTVAALVDTIHEALVLPHPPSAYDVFIGGDEGGEGVEGQREASLGEVSIRGCDERVALKVTYGYVARAALAAEGIETASAAGAALSKAVRRGAWGRVRQIEAAGLMASGTLGARVEDALDAGLNDAAEAMLEGDPQAGGARQLLVIASARGAVGVVERLLARGAEADAISAAFDEACSFGDKDMARILLAGGADVNARRCLSGHTALHEACLRGYTGMAELLLAHGADVDAMNSSSNTALHLACAGGGKDIAALLLAAGADVNAKGRSGDAPLHKALDEQHEELAAMLVEAGADVNARGNVSGVPLHTACFRGCEEAAGMLVARGADVHARGDGGDTALHGACFRGNVRAAEMLVKWGADVGARDGEGKTPLHEACFRGHAAVAQMLVRRGADVHATDSDERTAVDQAMRSGHVMLAESLVQWERTG